MTPITRKAFLQGCTAGLGMLAGFSHASLWAQAAPVTARDIMKRMAANVGVKAFYPSADTVKIGDPDQRVTGVTTTFMSTLDLLERSMRAGNNFVISHEPTFWSSSDVVSTLRDDPLYQQKVAFCERNRMVVMRYHDAWHAHRPDGIFTGFNTWTGWQQYAVPNAGRALDYVLPPTTAGAVAQHLSRTLKQRSIRLVGDPATPVTRVGLVGHYIAEGLAAAAKCDLLMAGESREWECAEYMRDAVALGQKKAYIQLSHEGMEEAGMDNCATWLRGFVTEVPIKFIASGDPFWIPS